ncbi:MAG: response regulator [Bdellovibrionales bacterium]
MPSLLIVDDEQGIIDLFKDVCEAEDIEVHCAMTGDEAIEVFKKHPCDYILTDIVMPGDKDGLEVILEIKEINPDVIVFAMTGDADPSEEKGYLDVAEVFGADAVYQKPLSPRVVIDKIKG